MKQRIDVKLSVPGYGINILSVHVVDDCLIVLSSVEPCADITEPDSDTRVINVTREYKNVVYFLTGFAHDDLAHYSEFGNDFIPVPELNEISEILDDTVLIYQSRMDVLQGLRSALLQQQDSPKIPIELPYHDDSSEPIHGLLNIYPVLEDDAYTVVIETIYQKRCAASFKSLKMLIDQGRLHAQTELDLSETYFMVEDDSLYFDGIVDDIDEEFVTHAVQFSVPYEDLGSMERFLGFITGVLVASKMAEAKFHAYSHATIGDRSILSCFDELLICPLGNKIIYPEAINIDHFYHKPAPLRPYHPPKSFDELTHNETVSTLCARYPKSKFILSHMQKSGIFSNGMEDNKTIVACVIHACSVTDSSPSLSMFKSNANTTYQPAMMRALEDFIKSMIKAELPNESSDNLPAQSVLKM